MSSSLFSKRGASVLMVAMIAVLVLALALTVVACGKASLVGKWYDASEDATVEFTSDGKVISDEFAGMQPDYKAEGGKITITVAGLDVAELAYTLDGDTLTINDPETGKPATLKRVK